MKKIAGIYKITSPSGSVYIGQSWDIHNRWRQYRSPAFITRNRQPLLVNSFKKYGVANHRFEILGTLTGPPNNEQYNLDILEQFLMDEYRSDHVRLLNLREGGSGGRLHPTAIAKIVAKRKANGSYLRSEASIAKFRAAVKGRPGKPHSEETRRKLAEISTGKTQSADTKERNRQSQLGRKHSPQTKAKIGAANAGRKRPDLAERNRARGSTCPT